MARNIVFWAFWVLCISNLIKSTNAAPVEKDCLVDNKYEDKNWSGESLVIMVYVEEDEDTAAAAFSITYDSKDVYSVRDKLILSQKENEIYEYRQGNVKSQRLKTKIDISGWTQMEILMIGQQIIVKYMDLVALNHTVSLSVKGVVIHGSNISVCEEKTPTYLVKRNISAMIPLVPSRQAVNPSWSRIYPIILGSDDEFTPCFSADGDSKSFSKENHKIIWSTTFDTSHPTTRRMDMFLEIIPGHIIIYQVVDEEKVNFVSFLKQGKKVIEVSSENNDFSVSLDIFPQTKASSDNPNEGTVIYLKIGIAIAIIYSLAVIVIVIVLARRQIQADNKNNSIKTSDKEDNAMELEHLNDDKYDICKDI